jgi:methyl-accepting chemotaxis protein
VARSVERLDQMAQQAVHTVDGVRAAARRVVREALANAAGALAVLREGVQWIRPMREKGRNEP